MMLIATSHFAMKGRREALCLHLEDIMDLLISKYKNNLFRRILGETDSVPLYAIIGSSAVVFCNAIYSIGGVDHLARLHSVASASLTSPSGSSLIYQCITLKDMGTGKHLW